MRERTFSWRTDDSGVSLTMVLIFVTVVAVVIGAVLSFADVNFKTTIQLRLQSETAAAADGAGQIAVNALRKSLYDGTGDCLGTSDTLKLNQFYDSPTGTKTSAAIKCGLDTDLTVSDGGIPISSANKPPKAILNLSSIDPLVFDPNGHTIRVKGSIYSNDDIFVSGSGRLRATGAIEARATCFGDMQSTPPPDCLNIFDPPYPDPNYSNPPTGGSVPDRSVPSCPLGGPSPKKVTFQPGRYSGFSTRNALNALTRPSGCNNAIFAFGPGIYYFDFDGDWEIETGYVVAGDLVNVNAGTVPKIPGSCKVPAPPDPVPTGGFVAQNPASPAGAIFMLGRTAQIRVSSSADFEICGPYSATRPPIAIFGVDDTIPGVIQDQDGCITNGTCPAIDTQGGANFVVQGTAYLPRANVELSINSPSIQTFSAGVIARSLNLRNNGSVAYPVAQLPDNSAGVGERIVVYLKVYVCPNATTCDTTGTIRLDAKVALTYAPGGTGSPTMTVLTWNVKR